MVVRDEALAALLEEAERFGMSGSDILSCFAEWLHISYWRFDGEDFQVVGNFVTVGDEVVSAEENGQLVVRRNKEDTERHAARDTLLRLMKQQGEANLTLPLKIDDGPRRTFRLLGKYKRLEDGGDGMVGTSYECFRPLRQIAVSEGPLSDEGAGDDQK